MRKIFLLCFSFVSIPFVSVAAPLDNVFKDVEVSGTVRYRYESSSTKMKRGGDKSSLKTRTDITVQ